MNFQDLHRDEMERSLRQQNEERENAGLAPVTMPSDDDKKNLASFVDAQKSYVPHDQAGDNEVLLNASDAEHPFGNNANNMRVAARIASESPNKTEEVVVQTPAEAAANDLAKAAQFVAPEDGDNDDENAGQAEADASMQSTIEALRISGKESVAPVDTAGPAAQGGGSLENTTTPPASTLPAGIPPPPPPMPPAPTTPPPPPAPAK